MFINPPYKKVINEKFHHFNNMPVNNSNVVTFAEYLEELPQHAGETEKAIALAFIGVDGNVITQWLFETVEERGHYLDKFLTDKP